MVSSDAYSLFSCSGCSRKPFCVGYVGSPIVFASWLLLVGLLMESTLWLAERLVLYVVVQVPSEPSKTTQQMKPKQETSLNHNSYFNDNRPKNSKNGNRSGILGKRGNKRKRIEKTKG